MIRVPSGKASWVLRLTMLGAAVAALLVVAAPPAFATVGPESPVPPTPPEVEGAGVTLDVYGANGGPSGSIVVLIAITLLSVAPSLLLMTTSFTKVFVVLALTRNALGLQSTPPTQILAGLALFLSLFIMGPVLAEMNELGVQPYLQGEVSFTDGVGSASAPLREFMLASTRESDIALMTRAAGADNPATPADVPMTTLMPAFMLSELRAAFIIGFVIFVPFLVIDLVVSGVLMSMGMMMLPPVMVSLPFKLLLFVLVDGWALIVSALVGSYG
ncbi:MAG: flagellar type III secretion system pore protein FliP [Demequina sp.]